MPQESPTQPAEQTIQSDFPDPIAMATQSPQTQVTPITNAQANQAINKIDAAEKDKKGIRKAVILTPIIIIAVLAIGIPLVYYPLNSDLVCEKSETNSEYTLTSTVKVEFSNFQAAIVNQENVLHFNDYKILNTEYNQIKKQFSSEEYENLTLTKVDEHTLKVNYHDKRYTGQIGKSRPEAKQYIEEKGFTCK